MSWEPQTCASGWATNNYAFGNLIFGPWRNEKIMANTASSFCAPIPCWTGLGQLQKVLGAIKHKLLHLRSQPYGMWHSGLSQACFQWSTWNYPPFQDSSQSWRLGRWLKSVITQHNPRTTEPSTSHSLCPTLDGSIDHRWGSTHDPRPDDVPMMLERSVEHVSTQWAVIQSKMLSRTTGAVIWRSRDPPIIHFVASQTPACHGWRCFQATIRNRTCSHSRI